MAARKSIPADLRVELAGLVTQLAACRGLIHFAANGVEMRRIQVQDDADSGKLWRAMLDAQGAEAGLGKAIERLQSLAGMKATDQVAHYIIAQHHAGYEMMYAKREKRR